MKFNVWYCVSEGHGYFYPIISIGEWIYGIYYRRQNYNLDGFQINFLKPNIENKTVIQENPPPDYPIHLRNIQ